MSFSPRILSVLGFLTCVGLMGAAFFFQYQMELDPCPLCSLQRAAVITLGIIFLVAAIYQPWGWVRWVYSFFYLLAGAFGSVVAGRHVWLQNLPADEVPACGPGLNYLLDTFPLAEALETVFRGSGSCADVDWVFLGLTMPTWVLIWVVALTVFGIATQLVVAPRYHERQRYSRF